MPQLAKNRLPSRRPLKLAVAAGIVVLLAAAGTYALHRHDTVHIQTAKSQTNPPSVINYSPPSAQNTQNVNDNKQRIVQEEQNQTSSSSKTGKKTATPVITSAEQDGASVQVFALVTNLVEASGTCTLTATNGSNTVNRSVSVTADASTTDCQPFNLSSSDFKEKGQWTFTVAYSSDTASGTSATKTIGIQ